MIRPHFPGSGHTYVLSPPAPDDRDRPWPLSAKLHPSRQCGHLDSYEEKETDVNVAVSIVADAAASASDLALIISADSDLCPAIRTARSLNPGRGMIVAFPPRRSSFEIRSLIRGAFTIAAADLRNSLLPRRGQ